MRALRAEVGGDNRERRRQIALHRRLPVVRRSRRADPDRPRTCSSVVTPSGGRRSRRPASAGVAGAVCDVERGRERRLLREQRGDRLVDVGVAIDAVAARGPPATSRAPAARRCQAAAGSRACRGARASLEIGARDRAAPIGRGDYWRDGAEVRRDVQIDEPSEPLGDRRFIVPAQRRGSS